MNRLISGFKQCAHQAGQTCRLSNGRLVREFALGDFLENKLVDQDKASDIAIKALNYFCDEEGPHSEKFRFAVLTVGIFLNEFYASVPCDSMKDLQQPLKDLVSLLAQSPNEQQVRQWIESHFS